MTLRTLSSELGVSTGSFYWHFDNWADFVNQLLAFWVETYTEGPIRMINEDRAPDAHQQLWRFTEVIIRQQLGEIEIPFRAWATYDVEVDKVVRQVDQRRRDLLRELFADMGFEGADLAMRVRTFHVFYTLGASIQTGLSIEDQLAQARLRHAWLVRP